METYALLAQPPSSLPGAPDAPPLRARPPLSRPPPRPAPPGRGAPSGEAELGARRTRQCLFATPTAFHTVPSRETSFQTRPSGARDQWGPERGVWQETSDHIGHAFSTAVGSAFEAVLSERPNSATKTFCRVTPSRKASRTRERDRGPIKAKTGSYHNTELRRKPAHHGTKVVY